MRKLEIDGWCWKVLYFPLKPCNALYYSTLHGFKKSLRQNRANY